MTFARSLAMLALVVGSWTSLSANAAYQYVYTSQPFNTVDSFIAYGTDPITTSDFIQIVIDTPNLLTGPTNLSDAVTTFSVGSFSFIAKTYNDVSGQGVADLHILDFDSAGLPSSWYLYSSMVTSVLGPIDSSVSIRASNLPFQTNMFNASAQTIGKLYSITAYAPTGAWKLYDLASPVPEPTNYLLLLIGLFAVITLSTNRQRNRNI